MIARFCLALLLLLGVAAEAIAQLPGEVPSPPVREVIDENGVDVARGRLRSVQVDVSIGPAWPQGISFTSANRDAGWTSTVRAWLSQSGSTYTATIDGVSDSFTLSGGVYIPTEAMGATLTQAGGFYTYTSRSGAVAVFDADSGASLPFWDAPGIARAQSITYPGGVKLTYHYKLVVYCRGQEGADCPGGTYIAHRLQSITNSNGYQLKFTFGSNTLDDQFAGSNYRNWSRIASVRAIDNAQEYCNPSADSCTLAINWPSASYVTTPSGSGTQRAITDEEGATTRYTSGADFRVDAVRRPDATSDTTTVAHDAGGVDSLTRDGVTHNYTVTTSGATRTTSVTAPDGGVQTYITSTTTNLLTSQTNAVGKTTSYLHDANGRVTRRTWPEGNYDAFIYDARGNVTETRMVKKTGPGADDIVSTASFPSSCANPLTCNQPTSTTDPRGAVTEYEYAAHGGVTRVRLPAPTSGASRPEINTSYTALYAKVRDAAGNLVDAPTPVWKPTQVTMCASAATCPGSANETKITIGYGAGSTVNNLLPLTITTAAGDGSLSATVTRTYDAYDNLLTVDGPLAGTADTTRFRYDANQRLIGVVAPDPDGAGPRKHRAERYTLDAEGRITQYRIGTVNSQSDADWAAFNERWRIERNYDANARLRRQKTVAASVDYAMRDFVYDASGRPKCTIDHMNPAVWGPQAASCAPLQTTGPNGPDRVVEMVYDPADRVTQVKTAVGAAAASNEATSTYTDNGKLATLTDGEGNRTTYEYDGHDRLLKTRYPSLTTPGVSSTTDYEQPTYDPNGNVTSFRLRDGQSIDYTYDALNRLRRKDFAPQYGQWDTNYGYDNLGRWNYSSEDAGWEVQPVWDALGRQTSETTRSGLISMQYDLAGRLTRLTHPDGFFVTYERDVTGNVTAIKESGTVTLATYSYDDLGRRTSLTRGNGTTTTWSYDPVSRLASLAHDLQSTANDLTLGFTYNPASQIATNTRSNDAYALGNIVNQDKAETPNGLNQLTQQGSTAFTYGARGDLSYDGTYSYTYNAEGKLVTGGPALFNYDTAGRLAWSWEGGTGVLFTRHGQDLIGEETNSGARRRYVHGPGVDEPLVWYEIGDTIPRRFYHADERGSIVALTNDAGANIATYKYDEYGKPSTSMVRFGYTGQTWTPELGLWHYKARMYNPRIGRFMQPDPIGHTDGVNLYGYVSGDPLNMIDPSGAVKVCSFTRYGRHFIVKVGDQVIIRTLLPHTVRTEVDAGCNNTDEILARAALAQVAPGDFALATNEEVKDSECDSPVLAKALSHRDYATRLDQAWRMALSTNKEAGFNFGRFLSTGREGFGSVYKGIGRTTITWRSDFDALFMDDMWSPSIYFHIHLPGEDPNISPFDNNWANRTNAIVVAVSREGMRCRDGSR